MKDGLRCVVLQAGAQVEFGRAICEGLQANGCQATLLDGCGAWNFGGVDLILTYGPMTPLTPIIVRLRAIKYNIPPLVVWFTEQLPRANVPIIFQEYLGLMRHKIEEIKSLHS